MSEEVPAQSAAGSQQKNGPLPSPPPTPDRLGQGAGGDQETGPCPNEAGARPHARPDAPPPLVALGRGLAALPVEVLEVVLLHLPLESVLLLMQCAHHYRHQCRRSSRLWRVLCLPRPASLARQALRPTALLSALIAQVLVYAGPAVLALLAGGAGTYLTDSYLSEMIRWMPHLRVLDLSSCGLGEPGLTYLFTGERTPHVQRLVLANVKSLTDAILLLMAQALPALTHLDISAYSTGCLFTPRGIRALAHGPSGRGLESFVAVGCPPLTDVALEALARMCPQLRHVDCSGAFELTDFGVRCLLKHSLYLERLNVSYCWRLTDDAFLDCGRRMAVGARTTSLPFASPVLLGLPAPEEGMGVVAANALEGAPSQPGSVRMQSRRPSTPDVSRPATAYSTTTTTTNDIPAVTYCILGDRLQEVDATFCYQLGDRAVTHLSALPSLRVLKLGHCTNLTSTSRDVLLARGICAELTLEEDALALGEGSPPTDDGGTSRTPSPPSHSMHSP